MLTVAKRLKIRRKELEDIKEEIFRNLPVLNKREIRRHRIPYNKALTLELEEDGYENSAHLLRSFVEYQEEILMKADEGDLVWYKPKLKDERAILDILYEKLKLAEDGIIQNKKIVELDNLIKTAIYFANEHEDWWWIAEQLFLQSIESVKLFYDDGGKRIAIFNYVFGRFLFTQLNDANGAQLHLDKARILSQGQTWTTAKYLSLKLGNLYYESCFLLYQCLLAIVKQIKKKDINEAVKLGNIALRNALEIKTKNAEAECLYELGLCETMRNNNDDALKKFNKVLILYFSGNNKEGICKVRIQLFLLYFKLGKNLEAIYHLEQLLEFTEKNQLKHYYAFAHRYLGEYYLFHNEGTKAQEHLVEALQMFHEVGDYNNRDHSKNFAAVSIGLKLNLQLIELIIACDRKNKNSLENVIKLVMWKDIRVPFWDEGLLEEKTVSDYASMFGAYGEERGEHELNIYEILQLQSDHFNVISKTQSRVRGLSTRFLTNEQFATKVFKEDDATRDADDT